MAGEGKCRTEQGYANDTEAAGAPTTGMLRRGFLGGSGLAAVGAVAGGALPFAEEMTGGLLPASFVTSAMAQPSGSPAAASKGPQLLNFPGKNDKLALLGERPLVAETPEHLLDDDTTPNDKFFVRNNGMIPDEARSAETWRILVDGEVDQPLDLSLAELKYRFRSANR